MPSVLLCNHALINYAGSELVTLELARQLSGLGHTVSIASFVSRGPLRQAFDALGVTWLDLSDEGEDLHGRRFDLLWGHHFTCFDALLLARGIHAERVVYSCLSPFEPLECPPLYADRFSLLLANSPETREVLEGYGLAGERLMVMPNCVDTAWTGHAVDLRSGPLRSVAIVSNHVPAELLALPPLLQAQGVSTRIFGLAHEHRSITPELLAGFDAVVSIGRTVLSALALAVPVYCYDRFGGPGYLDEDTFERAAFFNFSGRCCRQQRDVITIAAELSNGFAAARDAAARLATRVRRDYRLEDWIERVLSALETCPPLAAEDGRLAQARRLQAGRVPAPRLLEATPVRDWLQQRVPNARQRALVRERLAAPGAAAAICVIVHECDGDRARLARTLESLAAAAEGLPALDLHVIGAGDGAADAPLPCRHHACDSADLPDAVNTIARTTRADWLLLVEAGACFTPWGLLAIAAEAVAEPGLRAVYADEMLADPAERDLAALLRPDFNLDLLLSMPAGMARHWLYHRERFVEAGGFDPAFAESPEFELLLRLIESGGIAGLGHVHEPLLVLEPQPIRTRQAELDALQRHLRNRGYDAATVAPHAPGCYRIDYGHAARPGVSIVIPTKNQLGMLRRCVETLLEKTAYRNYELLIVDNGSDEADACAWLDGIEAMHSAQLRVLRYPHPFNYSAMNNLAARHARGDYLLLLNNDTAILREDWLDAMLNHAQRPEVGIVGAKLLYPDGRTQHAGVVLGLRGPAEHPFNGSRLDAPGYMHRLQLDQDYTAVTGACLLVRKSVYEDVGGLDEDAFKVSYNDVDLCLKVRQAGYLVVWTPHAVLLHEGSVSQNRVDDAAQAAKRARFLGEQDALYAKWLPVIADDPAYNRNLSLEGPGFVLETRPAVNWHPLTWRPLPVVQALAGDQTGCGHYRIIQPIRAMDTFGLADANWEMRYPTPVELERRQPDSVILQRQMFEDRIEPQRRLARFSRAFRVAELDDYLPNLPRKSVHHGKLPKDVLRTMREALKLVDRFVVSTQPLAEALHGLHPDIRVVENRLPLPWWAELNKQRGERRRPRVGWGGGAGHRGDLELIADVVRALADEVEWVFLGMCPDALRPYVHEFHAPVAIDAYPATLAGLDLDLALAPLEDNLFNHCKSNLRLLEYGACGFPVVCSDIAPYQGTLPVTRVKPRFRDWVDAIRMHTHDLDAAAAAGDALRAAVHRDWMLDERHTASWLAQWLPD
ncbi:MAG: glycosyltransferase [Pseudomonas sp.]